MVKIGDLFRYIGIGSIHELVKITLSNHFIIKHIPNKESEHYENVTYNELYTKYKRIHPIPKVGETYKRKQDKDNTILYAIKDVIVESKDITIVYRNNRTGKRSSSKIDDFLQLFSKVEIKMPAAKKKAVKSSQQKTYTAEEIRTIILSYLKDTDRCSEAFQIANDFLNKKLGILANPKEGECWLALDSSTDEELEVKIIKNYHDELMAIDDNDEIWSFENLEFVERQEEKE